MNMLYRKSLKRVMDLIASLIFFMVFWWIFVIIGILVSTKLGKPVIFKQKRPGKNGKIFTMYKFRSMTDEKDEKGIFLSDEKRLTRFGKLLRETSLDELPELWNVLKGDMSLIGPRPLLVEYLEKYSKEQARRHDVKPGITGWAQINGRNTISWEEKFNLDVEYVDKYNLIMDIKILFLTLKKVFKREDISQKGQATMEVFDGIKNE